MKRGPKHLNPDPTGAKDSVSQNKTMKLTYQTLTLLLISLALSVPMQVPAAADTLAALGRSTASSAGHFIQAPIAATSHSIEGLTIQEGLQVVRIYKNQDLGPVLNQPGFSQLLKNKQTAAQIYNEVKGLTNQPIKQELEILATDFKFPGNAEDMARLALQIRIPETADVIVKTPEFQKMTEDLRSLQSLILTIRDEKNRARATAWDPYYDELNNKFQNLVLKSATETPTPPYFARKLQDEKYARSILAEFKKMEGKIIPPQALALVQNAAYSPVLAKLSTAKNMDEFVQQVRILRDEEVLSLIEHSSVYERIIEDPFKAFQLKGKVVGNRWDQSPQFFETLRQASVRKYTSVQEVLVTLRDLKFATANSNLREFRPYDDFINNPVNAKNVLTAIENAPSSYTAFTRDELAFEILKAKAYQGLLPAPGSTAEQIAHSYYELLRLGATRDFEKNEVYKSFIAGGDESKIALLRAMEALQITRNAEVFKSIEDSLIWSSMGKLSEGQKQSAFLEGYLKTSEGANLIYKVSTFDGTNGLIWNKVWEVNPAFIKRLIAVGKITSKQ